MKFLILIIIGIIAVIVTRAIMGEDELSDLSKGEQVTVFILAIVAINLVGGIIVSQAIVYIPNKDAPIGAYIVIGIIGAVLTYFAGFLILGLYKIDYKILQICFVIVFIFSIAGWTTQTFKYEDNIEITTETVIVSEQERELLYFYNIPVQKLEDTDSSTLVDGEIDKALGILDEIPFWYINKSGKGKYLSVSAKNASLNFIKDDEIPYVKTITKCKQTTTINNNNGKETVEKEKEWKEYVFYIPESIMK